MIWPFSSAEKMESISQPKKGRRGRGGGCRNKEDLGSSNTHEFTFGRQSLGHTRIAFFHS